MKDKLADDERWCTRLAYLADIFGHLTKLNELNILSSTDKIWGFMGKLILWCEALVQGSMDMLLASAVPQAARERTVYPEHLQTLKERFKRYFPCVADIEDCDWIRDPFNQESSTEKALYERERGVCRAPCGPHTQTQI